MSHTIFYTITPEGIHTIAAASPSGDKGWYTCRICDPDGEEYLMLVDSANIYESKQAAERKIFHDKLKGAPAIKKPETPRNTSAEF